MNIAAEKRRHSKQRETILEVLRGTHIHPSAEWIYERVRKELPQISLGTIYRNLRLLSDLGYVREIHLGDSQTRYDSHLEEHQHFICSRCHDMTDIDDGRRTSLYRRLEKKLKCSVVSSRIDFFGLCRRCLKQSKSGACHAAHQDPTALPKPLNTHTKPNEAQHVH